MISAKELMLGNLFYPIKREGNIAIVGSIPMEVTQIRRFSISYCLAPDGNDPHKEIEVYDIHLKDIEPIKLTEDWLKAFEFIPLPAKEVGPGNYAPQYYFEWKMLGLMATAFHTGRIMLELYLNETYIGEVSKQYVHELQNLMYVLEGVDELKLLVENLNKILKKEEQK